jgi:hypothetical protein
MKAASKTMVLYYVNRDAQDNDVHIVHKTGCWQAPVVENRLYLGVFSNCRDALRKAKEYYPPSNGCADCCRECLKT